MGFGPFFHLLRWFRSTLNPEPFCPSSALAGARDETRSLLDGPTSRGHADNVGALTIRIGYLGYATIL